MNCFENCLSKLKSESGLSYSKLAKELGVSERVLKYYISGGREPTLSVLKSIADYFKVPIDYLTGKGIFSKWEDIMENKDVILDQLIRDVPALEQYDLYHADERDLMQIFPALIHDIIVRETPDGVQIGIELYSLWKK